VNAGINVAELVPHAGTMCLLERVVSWNASGATAATRSHSAPGNPLRRAGTLSALCLCEYGAQAMAVHGALAARAEGRALAPGLLVSLREVEFALDSVDTLSGELLVTVERLAGGPAGLQYRFEVSHGGRQLAIGRAAIIESRSTVRATDPPEA
jgi:predicted hotdog family 3-hydroxylacyl-ACP dehydratase